MNNCNLIFATHRKRGIEFLENLIGEFKYKDILRFTKSSTDATVELKDGTIYKVVSASDNSRGCKCNKAYVESGTNKQIIDCVIRPCIISNLSYEEQIVYFE